MKSYWILKLSSTVLTVLWFVLFSHIGFAQNGSNSKSLFFPVRPGEINYLSGTMGEIRSTHFHTGMDIKTSGISGLPIYAVSDGYVSRIMVSAGGYGHALYLHHPDGKTSVYAHLLQYRKDIADYVREEQYKRESFEVNLFPEKEKFIITRGELIALSGNTGSSMGPHLHFEIRDSNQRPINPLTYRFSEIKDDIPPSIRAFALKTLDIQSRVENQFGRFEYPVKNNGTEYYYDKPIPVYGHFGIQIDAYDRLNGASNRNGIPKIALYLDDRLMLKIEIDSFSFSDSRHVKNFYDYEVRKQRKKTYQKLYIDDGNDLPFYKYQNNKGIISIVDDKPHEIKIILEDIRGNEASLVIPVQGTKPVTVLTDIDGPHRDEIETSISENYMIIKTKFDDQTLKNAFLYSNRMRYELLPAYHSLDQAVYLWDLRIGLPDSVSVCEKSKYFNFEILLPSRTEFNFYNKVFDIKSFRKSLYDTIYLEAYYQSLPDHRLEIYQIGDPNIALANNIQINFKPVLDYSGSDKYALYSTSNFKNYEFVSNKWDDGQIKVLTKSFGSFTILEDTVPPQIKPVKLSPKRVSFIIKDDLSGIKRFEARLNGDWLLMHYDPKQNFIWSETLVPNNPVKGELFLYIEDNVGNKNQFETQIN